MSITIATTEAVVSHHLQGIMAQDLEALVSDYTEESVVLTPNGVFKGLEAIRAYFTQSLKFLNADVLATVKINTQAIDGEFAFVFWSAAPTITLAQDTFCIRNGKIVMQSFAAAIGG